MTSNVFLALYILGELNAPASTQGAAGRYQGQPAANSDRLPLHHISAIGYVSLEKNGRGEYEPLDQGALDSGASGERALLDELHALIDGYERPQIATFDGSVFELPLLMLRGMSHRLAAPVALSEAVAGLSPHIDLRGVFGKADAGQLEDVAAVLEIPDHNDLSFQDQAQEAHQVVSRLMQAKAWTVALLTLRRLLWQRKLTAQQYHGSLRLIQPRLQFAEERGDLPSGFATRLRLPRT